MTSGLLSFRNFLANGKDKLTWFPEVIQDVPCPSENKFNLAQHAPKLSGPSRQMLACESVTAPVQPALNTSSAALQREKKSSVTNT